MNLFTLANGALKWEKLKLTVKDNENNDDFNIWDFLGDELGLDTNGEETNLCNLDSYIGDLNISSLIEGGLKWESLKVGIKESPDFDIWDFLGEN